MSVSALMSDPGVSASLTVDDIKCLGTSLYQEMLVVEDPHEFATAFVNWRENAPPNTEINMWSAFNAVDYWRAYGTLDRLPYERLGGNG